MIICLFDFETSGLDRNLDRVVEVGAVLYSTGQKRVLEAVSYLVKCDVPITEKITALTGVTKPALDKFGYDSDVALDTLLDLVNLSDAYGGQNIKRFDIPFLKNWCEREKRSYPDKLIIDSRTDLPGVESKHLGYMAADHGFLNLFPHSALSDCQTVLKLIEFYDIEKIVERAKSPDVVLVSHQKFEDNAQAKELKFGWSSDLKIWYRIAKQMDVDEIVKAAPFNISVNTEIPVEKLWYS